MESILTTIKKLLGITEEYKHFDSDIIVHINMVLMTLNQIGIGPDEPYVITDEKNTWGDFLQDVKNLEAVKTYIYLKVRLAFDPPANSSLIEAFNRQITELEWRLNVMAETKSKPKED